MSQSSSRISVLLCAALLVGLVVSTSSAQAPDPLVGTWKLNLAASKYSPGPPPKSAVVKIETAGTGIAVAVDSVGADGAALKWHYSALPDGKDSPVMGNPAIDMVAATRTTPTTGSTVYKKAGKVVSTLTTAVSANGKQLTVTTKATDSQGRAVNNVAVYRSTVARPAPSPPQAGTRPGLRSRSSAVGLVRPYSLSSTTVAPPPPWFGGAVDSFSTSGWSFRNFSRPRRS